MTYIYINVYVRYLESHVNATNKRWSHFEWRQIRPSQSFLPFHHWAINGDTRKRFSTKALWSFFSNFSFRINRWSFTAGFYFTKEICVWCWKVLLKGNSDPIPRWHGQTCERRDAAKRNSDRIHSNVMKLLHKCSENLATIRWENEVWTWKQSRTGRNNCLENFCSGTKWNLIYILKKQQHYVLFGIWPKMHI